MNLNIVLENVNIGAKNKGQWLIAGDRLAWISKRLTHKKLMSTNWFAEVYLPRHKPK